MIAFRFHPYFHHFKSFLLPFNLETPIFVSLPAHRKPPAASCRWNPPVLQAPALRNVARAPCNPSARRGQRSARPPAPRPAFGVGFDPQPEVQDGVYLNLPSKKARFVLKEKPMQWVIGMFSKLLQKIRVGKKTTKILGQLLSRNGGVVSAVQEIRQLFGSHQFHEPPASGSRGILVNVKTNHREVNKLLIEK